MGKTFYLLLICMFLVLTVICLGQNAAPAELDPKVLAWINELANIQRNLTNNNTAGTELALKELARSKTEAGNVVRYEMFTKNLPHDQQYVFGILRINQQVQVDPNPKTLDSAGKVMDGPSDPVDLLLMAAKGEPYRFQLASKDGKYKAFAFVVPFPITSSDRQCSIFATLLLPDAEGVLLQGHGFKPGSSARVDINSEGEQHNGDIKADKDGNNSFLILPYKKNTVRGETKVTVSSDDCNPKLKFQWGKGTYHTE